MEKNNLFLKNFRKGIISIVAINVLFYIFLILVFNSIGITKHLFIISWMLLNIFISGQILFRYLEKNMNNEIKNIYFFSVLNGIIVILISYVISEIGPSLIKKIL